MALLTSRALGYCPICGVPNCVCGGPTTMGGMTMAQASKPSGTLIALEIRPGLSMKITEAEARRLGLLEPEPEPEEKMVPAPPQNKMRHPRRNKSGGE